MNIVQTCNYKFPATGSAGAERIIERLCRGLTKLGHKVSLLGKPGSITDTGAHIVENIPKNTDIVHHHGFELENQYKYNSWGIPWVSTIHGGGMEHDPKFLNGVKGHPNVLCVSKFVSDRLQCPAFVHNCASEEEFIYKTEKQNYFLSMASFGWGFQKGLDVFIRLARKIKKFDFYIAGSGNLEFSNHISKLCSTPYHSFSL